MMLTIQNTTNNHDHSTAKNYDVVYTYLFFCTFQKAMINPLQSYLQALSLCSSNSKNLMVMLGTRKRFSEKNNSCVYKLHSIHTRLQYMTKPVWSHVLALSALSNHT